ncbi:hypothetical protein G6N05_10175 [Flavobacterium sp. F372]|uniref:DUF1735 domain-containing protein n=1 Tax=Flavobacterium bernardetii TaxID=2813823 RepID=A0ABR7IYV8_9FLAO|nr:hypothetical protein [Flavobacterium bernardetii]MBC5834973.1 hypothetical protein [Flavobacterium bernardetii]NHF70474.1 hypothetical protein [Flavobacterium bernardetii]
MKIKILTLLVLSVISFSCSDKDDDQVIAEDPQLIIKFKFDPTQVRLNGTGQPSTIPAGNAAQSPIFNSISAHYLEFTPNALTQVGQGAILYTGPSTALGGANAIDFSQAKIVGEGEAFLSIPLKNVPHGSYEYVRVSLSYQNYNVNVLASGVNYVGTLASFVGYNNYITTHNVAGNPFVVNDDKLQGYWAFVIPSVGYSTSGQSTGVTTVPNPISSTSPIPAGSCLVTGKFANNFVVTGNETKNIEVQLSLSINNSFEWQEVNIDGKYEPAAGENVVDMGLRGLIPSFTILN